MVDRIGIEEMVRADPSALNSLTLGEVKDALGNRGWMHTVLAKHYPKVRDIRDIVAKHFGITVEEIIGSSRRREYAAPRQIAMYLSREMTLMSLPQIGRYFGDRDHTTVLFAYRKLEQKIQTDEIWREEVRTLRERIEATVSPRSVVESIDTVAA